MKYTKYSKAIIEMADYRFANPDARHKDAKERFTNLSSRTFDRRWKMAGAYNETRIQKQEQAKDGILVKQAKEDIKSAIKAKHDCLKVLSDIIDCKAIQVPVKTEIINGDAVPVEWESKYPSYGDIIKAIQQLSRIEGWETTKVDLTSCGEKASFMDFNFLNFTQIDHVNDNTETEDCV